MLWLERLGAFLIEEIVMLDTVFASTEISENCDVRVDENVEDTREESSQELARTESS